MSRPQELLGREIIRTLIVASVLSLLVALLGIYIFYGIFATMAPTGWISSSAWIPKPIEVAVVGLLCGSALLIAARIAASLSRRVVLPLNAVADGARRIAAGDLSARASYEGGTLLEGGDLLRHFNVMAERLERASSDVSRWNSMIAHELRTPVTILRGRLQGLADGVFEPDQKLFRDLVGHIDNLSRLVEDLRTVTLLESGHLDLRLRPDSLADMVRDTVSLYMPLLEADGFTLQTRLEDGLAEVDLARMRQVFTALLDNARRHAEPGMVTIELRFATGQAVLIVEDSGPGLAADLAAVAFEPFRRSDASVGKGGTGLGLAIVTGIAHAHGGTASYERGSAGARFVVRLPATNGAQAAIAR